MASYFKDGVEACGDVLQSSDVEWHNSIGVCERYEAHLRGIYWAVTLDDTSLHTEAARRLALKVIKETEGSNGLLQS